jgi:tartrate dehydrogenase/decarboxylase/D-malate dehydrogenase
MLDHLGHPAAAADILSAMTKLLAETGIRTPDLGGSATTAEVTKALIGSLAPGGAGR